MTSYIGIDVGKKSLHIYLPIADKSIEITNNQQGLAKLLSCCVEYYQHLSDIIIAFEPTGGYERELKEFLKLNKVNFVTVHPNKVRSYAKAKGWLAKTDLIDSKLLSEYATVFSLLVKQDYNCKSQEDLHCFIQRREQLIAFKNQEIARLENHYNKVVIKSIKSHINQLDK
jgi:transposase